MAGTIDLYNNGNMVRDFTYIDDVVEGVSRLIDKPTTANEQFDTMLPDGVQAMHLGEFLMLVMVNLRH